LARKKIVFVIVEGPSDDMAFGILLNRIYDKNVVHIKIMRGDITSDSSVNSSNIVARIGEVVKTYAKANHFERSHFKEIIHLIDMDGSYIPDGHVIEDMSARKPVYTLTDIRTANPDRIVHRNDRKRENIDRICSCTKIWTSIPYSAYYMSSNLDHVLYGKINSTDDDKENDAYVFAKQYKNNIPGFIEYLSESDFSVSDDYKESWNYIKEDLHSLERHTNFGICFQERNEEIPKDKEVQ
jgi:hypothetical protein